MADLTLFECFDTPAAGPDSGPSADWLAGHSTGFDEGRAAAAQDQMALRAATAQALADLTLSARDAQNLVLDRLAPLFAAIASQIVPAVLRETLGVRLAEMLGTAAAQDARSDLLLCVAPREAAAVSATLAAIAGGGLTVTPDARIGPGQILIGRHDGETCLDTGRMTEDIARAIAALADPSLRRTRHG